MRLPDFSIALVVSFASLVLAAHAAKKPTEKPAPNFKREQIEWCDIWIPDANVDDQPRVLLIGDSITRAYYKTVAKHLDGKSDVARFATSACVADPTFRTQLRSALAGYTFDTIHINNGLHGFDYTEKEYQAGYNRALALIKRLQPEAKLVIALTTPLQSTSDKKDLNPRVDARNKIARKLAKRHKASINDLSSISKDHPEYYSDPYHFNPDAIELQGKQVSEKVLDTLK